MKKGIISSIAKSQFLKITGFMFIFFALLCLMPSIPAKAADAKVVIFEHPNFISDGDRKELVFTPYIDQLGVHHPATYFPIEGDAEYGAGSDNLEEEELTIITNDNYIFSETYKFLEGSYFPGDVMSSIKIPAGYMVILYEHPDFSGNSIMLTEDVSDLSTLSPNFNDKVSSMEILYNPNSITNIINVSDNSSFGIGWIQLDGVYKVTGDVVITGAGTNRVIIDGGTPENPLEVTLRDLTINASGGPAITLEPESNVILVLDNTNVLTGSGIYAGIRTTEAKLTIEAGLGEASLSVSSTDGAGIGGNGGFTLLVNAGSGSNGGTITINGGKIISSSIGGAGIGGGKGGDDITSNPLFSRDGGEGGYGADLSINGGTVIASSTEAAAIGGGNGGSSEYGDSGSRGDPGSISLPSEYTFQTSENGTVFTSPPNSFTLSNDYRYVKIDCYQEPELGFHGTPGILGSSEASRRVWITTDMYRWTATSDSDWLTVSLPEGTPGISVTGTNESYLNVYVKRNNTVDERTGTITVGNGNISKLFEVVQRNNLLELNSVPIYVNESNAAPRIYSTHTINITEPNQRMYYTFKAPNVGFYTFYSSENENSNPYIWLNDSNSPQAIVDDDSAGQNNFKIQLKLEKDQEVTFAVGCYGNQTGSFTLTASRNAVIIGAEPLTLGIAANVELQNRQRTRYYVFTAEQEGSYIFSHNVKGTNDKNSIYNLECEIYSPDGSFNSVLINTNEISEKCDLKAKVELTAGQQVYIREEGLGPNNMPARTHLLIVELEDTLNTSFNNAAPITRNGTRLDLAMPSRPLYYSFTPDSTGMYTFDSSDYGNNTPLLSLYNSDRDELISGERNVRLMLTAGETYYIVGALAGEETGSYDLNISQDYISWAVNTAYEAGQIISYGTDSNGNPVVYTVLQNHTSMRHWAPGGTPSLYKLITSPIWSQPIGPHDSYSIGIKVIYNGKEWVSTIDGNVWRPGIHGWALA